MGNMYGKKQKPYQKYSERSKSAPTILQVSHSIALFYWPIYPSQSLYHINHWIIPSKSIWHHSTASTTPPHHHSINVRHRTNFASTTPSHQQFPKSAAPSHQQFIQVKHFALPCITLLKISVFYTKSAFINYYLVTIPQYYRVRALHFHR